MKKQTAVQWLQDSLDIHFSFEHRMQFEGLFQQAKEMEKEQIKDANIVGVNCGLYGYRSAEQYFNKTYKK
jgi:hypothetical protein